MYASTAIYNAQSGRVCLSYFRGIVLRLATCALAHRFCRWLLASRNRGLTPPRASEHRLSSKESVMRVCPYCGPAASVPMEFVPVVSVHPRPHGDPAPHAESAVERRSEFDKAMACWTSPGLIRRMPSLIPSCGAGWPTRIHKAIADCTKPCDSPRTHAWLPSTATRNCSTCAAQVAQEYDLGETATPEWYRANHGRWVAARCERVTSRACRVRGLPDRVQSQP